MDSTADTLGRRSAPGAAEPENLSDLSWFIARSNRLRSMNLTPSSVRSCDVNVTNVFKSISFWMKFSIKKVFLNYYYDFITKFVYLSKY